MNEKTASEEYINISIAAPPNTPRQFVEGVTRRFGFELNSKTSFPVDVTNALNSVARQHGLPLTFDDLPDTYLLYQFRGPAENAVELKKALEPLNYRVAETYEKLEALVSTPRQ